MEEIKNQETEKEETVEAGSIVYPLQASVADTPVVTADMLKYFYEKKEVLQIKGTGYLLKIDGNQIRNYANELITRIEFQEEAEGITFILNEGKDLCGAGAVIVILLVLYVGMKKRYWFW